MDFSPSLLRAVARRKPEFALPPAATYLDSRRSSGPVQDLLQEFLRHIRVLPAGESIVEERFPLDR